MTRKELVEELLKYPEDTEVRIINTDYVMVPVKSISRDSKWIYPLISEPEHRKVILIQ